MDREEAQRNHAIQTFNLFNEYMGNPEKSTGLFTNEKDNLTYSEKRQLKDIFQTAQDNESVMWQTVISFDNRWLEQNGIYNSKRQMLDERKLKEVIRLAVNRLLKSEGLEHAVWSAGIHYNTDNLHVHIAIVEPYPMREKMMYDGNKEVRGKFKLKNLNACKSAVVNEIMRTKDINLQINNIIRKDIIASAESRSFRDDPVIREQFLKLYENLHGVPKHKLNYNNHAMKAFQEQIDCISRTYIERYCKEDYQKFTEILQRQSKLYAEAYGGGKWDDFEQTKKQDLYSRMGNFVLREIRAYEYGISKKEAVFEIGREETHSYFSGYGKEKAKITKNFKEGMALKEPEMLPKEEANPEQSEAQETEQIFEKSSHPNKSSEPYMDYFEEWKEKDISRGVEYLKDAEEKGNTYAKILLGKMYLDSDSVIYDVERGIKYMTELAESGNEYGCYYLGKEYVRKESLHYNEAKGIRYLETAKEQGNDWAKYFLGKVYLDQTSSEYRPELGLWYMTELSESGNEYAQMKLGFEYLKGKSVERNIFSAYRYFSQAAMQGNKLAEAMMMDLSTVRTGRRMGNPLGELDKVLMELNRSFRTELTQSIKNIRQYDLEQEYTLEGLNL